MGIKEKITSIPTSIKNKVIQLRQFDIRSLTPKSAKQAINSLIIYSILIATMIIMIFPFFWVFLASFRTSLQIFTDPWALPTSYSLENYFVAIERANLGLTILNSTFVTFASLAGLAILAPPAAYIMAKPIKGMRFIFYFAIMGMFVPSAVTIIPLIVILRVLGLTNTLWGLVVAYVGGSMPYCLIIQRASFMAVPPQLEESAKIDGLSAFHRFYKIALPIAMPGIITSLIIQGIFFWNDFFNPLILIRSRRNFTLQLALAAFKGSFGFEIATLAAGVLLSLIPILVFYIVFADFIRRGIAGGVGIKGL